MGEVTYDRDGLQIQQEAFQRVVERVGELRIVSLALEERLELI
jgi:hypothetical protein